MFCPKTAAFVTKMMGALAFTIVFFIQDMNNSSDGASRGISIFFFCVTLLSIIVYSVFLANEGFTVKEVAKPPKMSPELPMTASKDPDEEQPQQPSIAPNPYMAHFSPLFGQGNASEESDECEEAAHPVLPSPPPLPATGATSSSSRRKKSSSGQPVQRGGGDGGAQPAESEDAERKHKEKKRIPISSSVAPAPAAPRSKHLNVQLRDEGWCRTSELCAETVHDPLLLPRHSDLGNASETTKTKFTAHRIQILVGAIGLSTSSAQAMLDTRPSGWLLRLTQTLATKLPLHHDLHLKVVLRFLLLVDLPFSAR